MLREPRFVLARRVQERVAFVGIGDGERGVKYLAFRHGVQGVNGIGSRPHPKSNADSTREFRQEI